MALNNEIQNLISTVHKPSIFYMPERLFPNLDANTIEQFEGIGFLNTLLIIDANGDPHPIKSGIEYFALLRKPKILKSNVLQLIEMKSKLDKEAFLYLLKDYTNEVDTWVSTSEVIRNEAKIEAKNYLTTMQSYLDLQHHSLKEHQTELKAQFGKWKTKVELDRIAKFFRKTSINISQPNNKLEKSFNNNKIGDTVDKKNNVQAKSQKKKTHLSNEDADKYLLKTVFNVKI